MCPQLFFNDCRDNEARQAKHGWRSNHSLMALGIASSRVRHPWMKHLDVTDDMVTDVSDGVNVRSNVFTSQHAPNTSYMHFDSQQLVQKRDAWPSTSPRQLEIEQCILLMVLQATPECDWEHLWISSLYRQHCIVTDGASESGQYWYVFIASPRALVLYEMEEISEDTLQLKFDPDAFHVCAPKSFHTYMCVDYDIEFDMSEAGTSIKSTGLRHIRRPPWTPGPPAQEVPVPRPDCPHTRRRGPEEALDLDFCGVGRLGAPLRAGSPLKLRDAVRGGEG